MHKRFQFQFSGGLGTNFRNFGKHTGAGIEDLFLMAATTPANSMGIGHLTGSIVPGKWANLVILDPQLQLKKVIFRGEEVKI